MAFNVSTGAAYAVLYSILITFTLLAFASVGWFDAYLPPQVTSWFVLKHGNDGTPDYFLSARNSAGPAAIALSFFASGMGAWVLYGTTEMGATPRLSWLGVLGYSGASAFPALLICWLGPKVRAMSEEDAFSTTDFGRRRYGRVMQCTIAAVSIFYMFIFIVAELTAISAIFADLTNTYTKIYGVGISISLGIFTILYTSAAGLPASLVTDKFQAVIMAILVITLTIAVTSESENKVSKAEFDLASNFTTDGLMAAVTLFIAIASAELFNQGTWQRVWAAEDVPAMRKGFLVGSIMVFFLMMFFGIMGMIAYAKDPESYDAYEKFAFLAFFDLLAPLGNGWHIVVLILVTALAASSIDSLQTGLTSVFSHDLVKLGYAPKQITRLLVVIINIPAIYLASEKYDVLSLFLVADLVCSTSVFPVFLGLQTTDYGILKAPTELGAFMGCVAGVVTVLINGVVNNAEGGIFEYFWLENEAICALCGSKTMVSFILTPVVSCIMTYVFTIADLAVRGERARQPIFTIAWDEKDVSKMVSESSDEGENEWDDMPKDTEAVAVDTEAVAMDADIVEVDSEKDDVIKPIETLMSSEVYTDA